MTTIIPILESERLRLRGHRLEDYRHCAALWGDPEVTRFIGGRPLSGEEVWARVLRYAGHWVWMGYGYWVVEEKFTGKFVGEVGYANLKREIQPSLGNLPELGWVLATPFHRGGMRPRRFRPPQLEVTRNSAERRLFALSILATCARFAWQRNVVLRNPTGRATKVSPFLYSRDHG